MKKIVLIWVISVVVTEGLRFIVGIDKLANEIQVLSAIPWLPMFYHMYQIHERHKRIEHHLKEGQKNDKENRRRP